MSESRTDDPTTGDPHHREAGDRSGQRWLSGFVALIGLWLAVAPFLYEATQAMLWNNLLVGGAIFLLAGYNYYRLANGYRTSVGVLSLVALLALWIAVSEFTVGNGFATTGLEVTGDAMLWNNAVAGLMAAVLSGYVAYAARKPVPTGTAAGPQ